MPLKLTFQLVGAEELHGIGGGIPRHAQIVNFDLKLCNPIRVEYE